jgi:Na+-translocating ferredoxin:NAD+ oxidoreductase subunit G
MKEMARYGLILAVICVVAAGLLAAVNSLTGPKILAAALAEEQTGLKEVMPLAVKFTEVKSKTDNKVLYYNAFDNQGKLIGFVFKAGGKGYSSVIETLVGMFLDGKISAIKVMSLNETPGLGMRVAEKGFTVQFSSQDSADLSSVEAITGATISSRAVMNSVMQKAKEIKELAKNYPSDFAQGYAERTEGEPKHVK